MVRVKIFNSWVTVKNEIFNSKMKFLIRGILFPGDGFGKNWNKDKLINNPGILHKKVIDSGIISMQYVEDKKIKKILKKVLTNIFFYVRICMQGKKKTEQKYISKGR